MVKEKKKTASGVIKAERKNENKNETYKRRIDEKDKK
jgi:hypothetical protein